MGVQVWSYVRGCSGMELCKRVFRYGVMQEGVQTWSYVRGCSGMESCKRVFRY